MERPAKRIMVANDNREFLGLMQDLLSDEAYEVTTCYVSDHCYQQVREQRPDLVILDLRMPDPDGWQVLQLLRLDPGTAEIPVLVCSAAVTDLEAAAPRLREQGCDILLKPFNLDELLETVGRLIGNGHH